MRLSEYLMSSPDKTWRLAAQLGVRHAVVRMPENENGIPSNFSFETLKAIKEKLNIAGFSFGVIEPAPANQLIKSGAQGRDEEIDAFICLLHHMGQLGIQQICPNFMYKIGWYRTRKDIPTRGGALVTGFFPEDMEAITDETLTEEKMWDNLWYFLSAVVPEAEKANVQIALHPDDPPVPKLSGIPRILISPGSFDKIFDAFPSHALGLTLCQGCFSAMGANIPENIRRFAGRNKLFAAHFRDISGTAVTGFQECFHDDGNTDMAEAVQAYCETCADAFVRVDHVPTMYGEVNERPGYETLGRLFAIGYWKGLYEATTHMKNVSV